MYVLIQQAPLRWPDPVKHGITVSEAAKDLISRLLEKDRKKRLGQKGGVDEILAHEFFKGVNFDDIITKKVKAEFIPEVDKSGLNNFDEEITRSQAAESLVDKDLLAKIKGQEESFKEHGFED